MLVQPRGRAVRASAGAGVPGRPGYGRRAVPLPQVDWCAVIGIGASLVRPVHSPRQVAPPLT